MQETEWCEMCEQPMISNGLTEAFECKKCGDWIGWDSYWEQKAARWGRI